MRNGNPLCSAKLSCRYAGFDMCYTFFDVAAVTDKGTVRDNNEDNFLINESFLRKGEADIGSAVSYELCAPLVACICDGMGGEARGETASMIAVDAMSRLRVSLTNDSRSESVRQTVLDFIDRANNDICDEIERTRCNMGTTVCVLCGFENGIITANIGDSRIYRLSRDSFEQLSADHTELQRRLRAGMDVPLTMQLLYKSRLTQHLGIFPDEMLLEPEVRVLDELLPDDVFLLCSDGLTDMLTDEEIENELRRGNSASDMTKRLIDEALARGGKDNVTVITIKIQASKNSN